MGGWPNLRPTTMVKSDFGYNSKVEGEVIVTRADAVVNWVRSNSVWPW